ncbi:MAG: hypothetical protein JO095_19775 [Alphaproteobacteria bacterium]|nr:hypothetical protein [Alphaproteobacteria bacterium]
MLANPDNPLVSNLREILDRQITRPADRALLPALPASANKNESTAPKAGEVRSVVQSLKRNLTARQFAGVDRIGRLGRNVKTIQRRVEAARLQLRYHLAIEICLNAFARRCASSSSLK